MRREKYTIFIEDSGSKEYIDPYKKLALSQSAAFDRKFWLNNYFVILGIIIKNAEIPAINRALVEIKQKTFGTSLVEIKSDWFRNSFQRKKRYLQPFGINEEKLNACGHDVTGLFSDFLNEIRIIAVVFDKRYYKNRKHNDPFCNSSQVLFERIEFYMNEQRGDCVLVVDQMEDSLCARRGRNKELQDVLYNSRKMKQTFIKNYKRIVDISFRKSKHENLIQLADLAA